jgi:predicted amidohydrolase YtcJ
VKSSFVWFGLSIFLLVHLVLTPAATADEPERLALVGGTVIQANGEAPIDDAVVLISGDQLEKIGPRPEVSIPEGYRTIDTTGRWVTPGLIDTNVHLILMTVPEFFVKYEDRLEEIAIQSAQVGLKFGLTTMADSWGPLEPLLAARDRVNSGRVRR